MVSVEEQVEAAFKEFTDVLRKYSKFGACDSEPIWTYVNYLSSKFKFSQEVRKRPETASQWKLYTASMDCDLAAHMLTEALMALETKLEPLFFKEGGADAIEAML